MGISLGGTQHWLPYMSGHLIKVVVWTGLTVALLSEKWSKLSWKDNMGQTILSLIQIS